MTAPLLELRDMRVSTAAGTELVRGVSLTVLPGRIVGLAGESGSGKSLTCLSALRLLPRGLAVTGGEVRVADLDVRTATPRDLRAMRGRGAAIIMQNPQSCFNPLVNVRTHMRETLAAHDPRADLSDRRLAAALDEVGLPEPAALLPLHPFQLSGGMLQRVMIAMALLLDAPLLLADEPTTDLDCASQARILNLLDDLRRKRNLGVLLVTHDLSVMARLADEVAIMRHGRIVEHGSVHDLFHRPRTAYARQLLSAHLRLYGLQLPERMTGDAA